MISAAAPIQIRASGRLCLLGEHADYLGLEVISFPLDMHLRVTGVPVAGSTWDIRLEDLGETRQIEPRLPLAYVGTYDYLAAGFERALARGAVFPNAYHVRVRSDIPIRKGVSSSSAFCVAWSDFLARVAQPSRRLGPRDLAEEAYTLEVVHFQQSGGMQDHYTIAHESLVHLDCRSPVRVTPLPAPTSGFVLGDSGAQKDTQGVLSRIRSSVERSLDRLGWPREALRTVHAQEVRSAASRLGPEDAEILLATVLNREQARRGAALLQGSLATEAERRELGTLLSEHHEHLRRRLRTSTAAIDRGLEVARKAGAFGGKVLGSGAGGCFLVYAPDGTETVLAALRQEGFQARAVGTGT
jgi:galactokinase